MSRGTVPFTIAAIVGAAVFALAFLAAPHSCDGGLAFYFWSGLASLVGLAALPFLSATGSSLLARLACSLGFAAFAAAVWFAGLILANVRILCRLF